LNALAAGDLLAAVVAARAARLGRAHGLAVEDRRRGLRPAADGEAVALAQGRVDPLPGALAAPLGVVVEHRRPGREVVRQGTPLAARPQQIEHGVGDAAQLKDLRAPGLLAGSNERPEDGPFFVGQVGRIGISIHPDQMVAQPLPSYASGSGQCAI
jgi:hypothetical protein